MGRVWGHGVGGGGAADGAPHLQAARQLEDPERINYRLLPGTDKSVRVESTQPLFKPDWVSTGLDPGALKFVNFGNRRPSRPSPRAPRTPPQSPSSSL
eukprot:8830430-Pyramimonas_sp.AAC.1